MKHRIFTTLTIGLLIVVNLSGQSARNKAQALNALMMGNQRFVNGLTDQSARQYPHLDRARLLENASSGQYPFATVIGCSDSRVPIEIIFDAGIGDIFPIRVAGNVSDVDEIGSIEYGVGHVNTPVMLVLGHTGCGAVTAVVENADVHGNIPLLVDNIIPAVASARSKYPRARGAALINYAVEENVWQSIADLINNSAETAHLVSSGALAVLGGVYHLETGEVEWLGEHPAQASLIASTGGSGRATAATTSHAPAQTASHAPAQTASHSAAADTRNRNNRSTQSASSTRARGETAHASAATEGSISMDLIMIIGMVLLGVAGLFFVLTKTAWKMDNLRIRYKIMTLSGSIAVVFSVALFYSSAKIASMGDGFREVEEVYIPLTGIMSKIEAHMFEQEISLLQVVIAERDHDERAMLEHEEEFEHLATQVKTEILEAERIVEEGEQYAQDKADLAWMEETLEHLKVIDKEHDDFDRGGLEIFALIAAGNTREASVLEAKVEEEGLQLAVEIEVFLDSVEVRTAELSAHLSAEEKAALTAVIILTIVAVLLATFLTLFISNGIGRSLINMIQMLTEIEQGEGDLTKRVNIATKDEIGQMGHLFDSFMGKMQALIKSIAERSDQVSSASTQISSASEELAAGAEEQQAQLSEVATTMEQMSAMILESSKNAEETRENAQGTGATANQGRNVVSKTVSGFETMAKSVEQAAGQIQELSRRSEEIGNVIQVIDDIADQTNLLALNANIEAARAGDAGRGFAVVADEVRKLAERTVTATGEIGKMIESIQNDIKTVVGSMTNIQSQSQEGLELVSESDKSLSNISSSIETVISAVEQIAASANEQSSGAEEISKNIEGVTTVAKESASSAQEMASSAEQLNREVEGLNELIGQFKVEAD